MIVGSDGNEDPIVADGTEVEHVTQFNFLGSLVYETLFIPVVHGSNETHISMLNLKTRSWNELKFWIGPIS